MLTPGISRSFTDGVQRLTSTPGVQLIAAGTESLGENGPEPPLFATGVAAFLSNPELQEEVFGSAALIVRYHDEAGFFAALENLQGQLTATVHATDSDSATVRRILPVLERNAGRILFNGWPTGVEVNDNMVHGGLFPATSDSRRTSVGSMAIYRFQRPVSYQNVPAELLPPAVQLQPLEAAPSRGREAAHIRRQEHIPSSE